MSAPEAALELIRSPTRRHTRPRWPDESIRRALSTDDDVEVDAYSEQVEAEPMAHAGRRNEMSGWAPTPEGLRGLIQPATPAVSQTTIVERNTGAACSPPALGHTVVNEAARAAR